MPRLVNHKPIPVPRIKERMLVITRVYMTSFEKSDFPCFPTLAFRKLSLDVDIAPFPEALPEEVLPLPPPLPLLLLELEDDAFRLLVVVATPPPPAP